MFEVVTAVLGKTRSGQRKEGNNMHVHVTYHNIIRIRCMVNIFHSIFISVMKKYSIYATNILILKNSKIDIFQKI